ncbi:MAG: primosomal protein N' [Pseudomonadota bacterium]
MEKGEHLFAVVALPLPLKKNLYYEVPPHLQPTIEPGNRVLVPLGKRKVTGYVVELKPSSDIEDTKPIEEILDPFPLFHLRDLDFFKWIASYYCCSLGEVIKNALPPGINIKTSAHLSLTPKGQEALANQTLSEPERQVLSQLLKKRRVALKGLLGSHKNEKSLPLITALVQKGYIAMAQWQGARTVKPRKEKVFQVNREQLAGLSFSGWKGIRRKAPRQFQILKWMQKQGKVAEREILSQFGKGESALKALEKKRFIIGYLQESYRKPLVEDEFDLSSPLNMTTEQSEALKKIVSQVKRKKYASFLLHGITGSGKTEVYVKAIEATLETGRGAMVLVPEIALTPQLMATFQTRFGENIAQIHSGLSQGERFDEWRRIRNGEASIVVGARSAIFAPLPTIGIIIVDEEHDPAYKQEDRICYNARDLSLVKGKMNNAVVILGSATPSIETYYNTSIGKINYLHLSHRIDSRPLPKVEIVDMRKEEPQVILSSRLKDAIKERGERGEQTLLFLNRRGFAPFMMCKDCGSTFCCPNCNVSLVYHQKRQLLLCHYCSFCKPAPEFCPNCRGYKVEIFGFGTERLEAEIHRLFPSLNIGRLDRDITTQKNALQQVLRQFRRRETELLIGTQMIAMGHDLPGVTLVGIIAADHSLNFPDFRAGERTFQLLTQVAGRSGRGQIPGEVIIQTYNPNHPSIQMAMDQDFPTFYKEEIVHRKELNYPPFYRLVNVRMVGNSLSLTREYATRFGRLCLGLQEKVKSFHTNLEMLGPAEAPWEKLKGKYRWQMLIKGRDHKVLHQFTEEILISIKTHINIPGVKLSVDIDPINLL